MLDSDTNALARAAMCDAATIQAWRSGATLPREVAARIARAYRALFGTADAGTPHAAPRASLLGAPHTIVEGDSLKVVA
ncbi:MAG: hypothetical protein QM756_24060 [Polyangiaceae bacterium]